MENNRNPYLVSKALKSFVLASILTAAAAQLASTLDAVVLAQFEGSEAVSALSLVMPITTFISCLGLMFAFGANALAARAIGRHDLNGASAIFSTAIWSILTLGLLFSLLMYAGLPAVMRVVTDEVGLRELPLEYLSVYVLGAWLEMLSYALCLFVATDGHPRRVTMAVFVGSATNVVVDVLAVGWFEWGVRGVAFGSLAQFAVNVLLLGLYLRHPSCSYRLLWPGDRLRKLFAKNVQEGAPVTISNILMALTVLFLNNIIYDAQGDSGLFFWSICLQMLMVSVVFINGVMEALFAIGGVMVGEHDLQGFSLLSRRALMTVSILVSLLIILMWIPDAVGIMFGIEEAQDLTAVNHVLRIFSLLMLPFALTLTLVAVYQVLERMVLSVIIVIGQLAFLVFVAGFFKHNAPAYVWYGFPLAGFLFLGAQLLYSYVSSRRQDCRVSGLTLIPNSEGGHSFDCSVPYRLTEVSAVLIQIAKFFEDMGIDKHTAFNLNLCLEELMTNIAEHSTGHIVHHSFDVHVFVKRRSSESRQTCLDGRVATEHDTVTDKHIIRVALKDGGRPFDPVRAGRAAKTDITDGDTSNLGLLIAANIVPDISYKYMYGLNILLIKI